MKKITLLSFLFLLPVLLSAQISIPKHGLIDKQYTASSQMAVSTKADGDIFWSTTFNFKDATNPQGWSWPAGWQSKDETDLGNVWAWGNDSIKGRFTRLPGLASHSPEDGWLQFTSDLYNYRDNVSTSNAMNAWFELPPINCSGKSSVIVKFYQNFRTCCGGTYQLKLQVTNDGGVHWADYDCRYGTAVNDWCLRNEAELNISEVAAGLPSVILRFTYTESTHYFWAIDDLSVSEGYHNELVLESNRANMINTIEDSEEGFLPYLPWKLIDGSGFGAHTFWGAMYNNGLNDQEGVALKVDITKNGQPVFSATSGKSDIWTLERDTVSFTETPFQPDGYGDYHFAYTAVSDNEEQVPSNNTAKYWLTVNDSIYSRCDDVKEDNQSTAGWVGGNSDGDYLGVIYTLTKPMEVNSLSVLITSRKDNPGAGTRPGMECQYWVFKNVAEEGWVPVISSTILTIEESHLEQWVTLSLDKDGESEFLEPGDYIAAIQTWHGGGAVADNSVFRFSIGYDQTYYTASKSVMLWPTSEDWGGTGKLNMIRMNLKETGAPAVGTVVFNVDMNEQIAKGSMNPATDFVDVAGTFNNWTGSAHMTDGDGDGVYTLTLPEVPALSKIEYKYRINGSWTIGEFPNGGPNRVATARYYTILNDIYNNGVSILGIDSKLISSSVNVYPNPTQGQISISIQQEKPTDTELVITNLQGQVVYKNLYRSLVSQVIPVDLTAYAKGIYLLKVNHAIRKLIIE